MERRESALTTLTSASDDFDQSEPSENFPSRIRISEHFTSRKFSRTKAMASDIQNTPFVKQLAANGTYSFRFTFPQPFPSEYVFCVPFSTASCLSFSLFSVAINSRHSMHNTPRYNLSAPFHVQKHFSQYRLVQRGRDLNPNAAIMRFFSYIIIPEYLKRGSWHYVSKSNRYPGV